MNGTITLKNGVKKYIYCINGRYIMDNKFYNATGFVKAVKDLVLQNCEYDLNNHHSFRNAKSQRCSKCKLLVVKNPTV